MRDMFRRKRDVEELIVVLLWHGALSVWSVECRSGCGARLVAKGIHRKDRRRVSGCDVLDDVVGIVTPDIASHLAGEPLCRGKCEWG